MFEFKTPAEIQAALANDDARGNYGNYYPFYRMQNDQEAIVRFLPDRNTGNPKGFMVEKVIHPLAMINDTTEVVPCLSMYDEPCPICALSQTYYKAEGKDSVNGKKYWRKRQYLFQALIIKDPLPADADTHETYEGKVCNLQLGWQLYEIIKKAFKSGEFDVVPYAFQGGCNFVISKTELGDNANYSVGSRFARQSTDLTAEQIAVVEDNIIDLSSLIPKHPGLEKADAVLEASVKGSVYIAEAPPESEMPTDVEKAITESIAKAEAQAATSVSAKKTDPTETKVETKVETTVPTEATGEVAVDKDEILAAIQQRRKAKLTGE